jgi:branched-chain amino acid transport system permease protein
VLWANYPQVYLASVGVIVLLAVLFMPRGIASLGMKNGWLATGRPLFRRMAARAGRVS